MPQETFYILGNEPVLVAWFGTDYNNLTVSHAGVQIQRFANGSAFANGVDIALDANTTIRLELIAGQLAVWQAGKNLMAGREDAALSDDFENATKIILWYGGFQSIVGLLVFIFSCDAEKQSLGVGAIISGLLFLGLSFWAKRSFSKVPLWIAFGLSVFNIIATLLSGKVAGVIISGVIAYRSYRGAMTKIAVDNSPKYDNPTILDRDL
jgi:hypothetical protein